MRYGIFSDVHGNLEALQRVMGAYEKEAIDRYISLGDTVGYGANPQECTQMVRNLASVTIVGNHDAAVSGRMDYSYYYDAARVALDCHRSLIDKHALAWLRSLPYEHREGELAFTHGSPVNLVDFDYVFAIEQARQLLPVHKHLAKITFIGHSHLCKAFAYNADTVHEVVAPKFTIRDEFQYIISVGSVGQPRDYDPRSSYTIYDAEERTFEFKRIEYDIERAAAKIFATANLERNFGNRLFLGV